MLDFAVMSKGLPEAAPAPLDIYGLLPEEIAALPSMAGQPAFRPRQIARWLYDRGATAFDEMTDISKETRRRLEGECRIGRIRPAEARVAPDDSATKYLFRLPHAGAVEAVWIRDQRRDTLCISSQAGCAYGCTFCATASMKSGRNLTPGEIIGQVAALRDAMAEAGAPEVHNLVFMGMGEPLANYESVVRSLRILTGAPGFGIAARRITISTVGLEPEIRRLAAQPVGARLAFSLNATTDEVRSEIMPVNRKYPFRVVFRALREYQAVKGLPVTLEYVLLKGINDTPEDAQRLARFAQSLQCKINLIAYNPHAFAPYAAASDQEIEEFRRRMLPAAMTTVTVRWSKGREIQAACGQLATASAGETH